MLEMNQSSGILQGTEFFFLLHKGELWGHQVLFRRVWSAKMGTAVLQWTCFLEITGIWLKFLSCYICFGITHHAVVIFIFTHTITVWQVYACTCMPPHASPACSIALSGNNGTCFNVWRLILFASHSSLVNVIWIIW